MLRCFVFVVIVVVAKAAPGYYVNGAYGAYGHSVPPATSYVSRTDYPGKSIPIAVSHATPLVTKTVISPPVTYNLLEGSHYPVSGYQYGHQGYPSGASNLEYEYDDDYVHGAPLAGNYGTGQLGNELHGYGATLGGTYGHGSGIVSGIVGGYAKQPLGGVGYGHTPIVGAGYGYGGAVGKYGVYDH